MQKKSTEGKRRAQLFKGLSKIRTKDHRLILTGVKPQQQDGMCASGVSDSLIARLRNSGTTAMRNTGHQASTTTRFEWWLGSDADPAVTVSAEQVKMWAQLWRGMEI